MSLHIDTSRFNAMWRDLAQHAGAGLENTITYEATKVLEAAVRLTPAASAEKIRGNALTGRAFTTDIGDGRKTYWMENRYPDAIWNALAEKRKRSVAAKLRARGLSKKSWWLLAKRIGFAVKAPAYVQQATPSDGKTYDNESVVIRRSPGRFGLVVATAMPVLQSPYVGGGRILRKAIAGRVRYFQTNLRKGVFKSCAQIAKKYPGVKTTVF